MNNENLRATINAALTAGRRALTAPEAQQLCEAYGIATPKQALATTASEAAEVAVKLGFPVVLKIVSDDILHKTEAGGVIVGLENAADVRAGFEQLVSNAKQCKSNASLQGVQVQQMLKGGQEVMVGAVTDATFGKMIAFGLGGILVEVMKDITFRMAPVSETEALAMLDSIAAAEVLRGVHRLDAGEDRLAGAALAADRGA